MVRLAFWSWALAISAPPAWAQWSGWPNGTVNTTLCGWQGQRAVIMHDTLWIDGGVSYWVQTTADGSNGKQNPDYNQKGYIFTIPLNTTMNLITDNITNYIDYSRSKARGGAGESSSNTDPTLYSGALLANVGDIWFYGGKTTTSNISLAPDDDYLLVYHDYAWGTEYRFDRGLDTSVLPSDVNRNIVYGAGASVPSEWKAYYFSGMRSSSGTLSFGNGFNVTDTTASYLADTIIEVETQSDDHSVVNWSNTTLPDDVSARTGGEFVFVPVGSNGVMMAIGGTTSAGWNTSDGFNANAAENTASGQAFLRTIDIYDIATKTWHKQNTSSSTLPPNLVLGCAVVASAQDASSHNIYYYGGYDGDSTYDNISDDVWVLSVPSFTWTKVYSGTTGNSRYNNICVKPYPDQMWSFGGMTASGACLQKGFIRNFNLSTATFVDTYDPNVWSEYLVPSNLTDVIGGTGSGGATITKPPNGWNDDDVEALFATKYDTSKITTYYPYTPVSSPSDGNSNTTSGSGSGLSKGSIAAIVVCSIIGGFLLAFVIFWFFFRRTRGSAGTPSETTTTRRIKAWRTGLPPGKVLSETTETSTVTGTILSSEPMDASKVPQVQRHVELPAEPIVRQSVASSNAFSATHTELDSRDLTHEEAVTHTLNNRKAANATSTTGSVISSGGISSESAPNAFSPLSNSGSDCIAESPVIGSASPVGMGHSRQVSAETFKSEPGTTIPPALDPVVEGEEGARTPQSDRTGASTDGPGRPYGERRSVFHESRDDLGEGNEAKKEEESQEKK